jgi:thiol-disulfide isomerase/thioredoxin
MFSNSFFKKYLTISEDENTSVDYNKKYIQYKMKYLKLKNQQNIMKGGSASNNNKLFLFKAEWCGHCKNFKSTWNKLQSDLKNDVEFVTYDADEHKDIITKYNIQGFPTLILNSGNKMIEYNGQRDIVSLKEFIKSYN